MTTEHVLTPDDKCPCGKSQEGSGYCSYECYSKHDLGAPIEPASSPAASMGEPLSEAELAAFAESAPERIDCELWTLLDWSLWAAGMGDTFREPLASTMVAAVPERARAQAELLMQEWLRIRNVESPSKTNAGLRAKLAEAEQARDEAIRVAGANAVAYDETRAEAAELRARVGVLEGQLATARERHKPVKDERYVLPYCNSCSRPNTDRKRLWPCPDAKALGLDGGDSEAETRTTAPDTAMDEFEAADEAFRRWE